MNMENVPQEERIRKDHQALIMKGKRTKRQRTLMPSLTLGMASSSSSGGQSGFAMASPTTSNQMSTISTEEDQDMANCLMLLARGQTRISPEPVAATTNKDGLDVYQCKTCNKCFPSFQALGGHRTSHKKPKPNVEENQKKDTSMILEENYQDNGFTKTTNTALSLHIVSKAIPTSIVKAKVHECSICGAEFSSGQALGGHMRRHRSYTSTSVSTTSSNNISEIPEAKKTRNILQLDLNLPAPEDDNNSRGFSFSSKEQVLVFSASPLIDCHY